MQNFLSAFTLVIFLSAANFASAESHKLRVTDRALADSLVSQGAKLLVDYGSFELLEIEKIPQPAATKNRARLADEFNSIELNAKTFDTRAPEIQALRKTIGAFSGKRLHMVQFVGPIKPEWRAALERTGVKIVHYLPQNAYLVYGDAAALARLQSWAAADATVQWDGDYAGDYKVHPRARATDKNGNARQIGTDLFAIQMVADKDANTMTLQLIDRLKLAPIVKTSEVLGYKNVVVSVPADQLDTIAAQPDVVSIHPYFTPKKHDERQDQILAGNLSGNSPSGAGYLAWLASKGFTQAQFDASGFVVDVSDSGIDNGTLTPGHFALYPQANISLNSRVSYARLEGTPNSGSTLRGCDGHGNLNAHILGGYSAFNGGFPHADSSGYAYGLGVCPFVKLGSSVVFDPDNFTSPDYSTLLTDAFNSGARISNNSWGSDVAGDYDSDAQQYDTLVRDVGKGASEHQMTVVFVAGNAGPVAGSTPAGIDSPGSAKNVITVGASENVRSMTPANGGNDASGNDGCGTSDSDADSANDIAGFSSQGPCADGRIKPDLVAPGTHITGGVPQAGSPTTNGTGSAISCFNGTGVCALPGSGTIGSPNNFFPLNQKFYTVSSGTSHSAPAVSGACALLRQYFINNTNTPPSPAMTKAFLMNSARYLSGNFANDTLPSKSQGMGEVNLGSAFDGVPRVLRDQLPADVLTASGQSRSFAGFVADQTKPFRVTVAWTDFPGSISAARELVNDLDLTVTVGGNTYKGNVFSGGQSEIGGTRDSKNNVESVFLPAGVSGPFTVTINAANIAEDAISNGVALPEQDFALVVYNATLTPAPAVTATSYALTSESCSPANGAVDAGETVSIDFTLQNLGTANTTNLEVTLLETNGVINPTAKVNAGALAANGGAAVVSFTFTAGGSCGDTITPTFSLKDGGADLGEISISIPLGKLATIYQQNFDGAPAPTLPAWWTTTRSNTASLWVTSKKAFDTPPNAAFSPEAAKAGVNALISPALQMPAGGAQLVFANNYNLESGYDGGVLEIKMGNGDFQDILDAGGSFVSGAYNVVLKDSANPLAGRSAWSGNSGGFIPTVVNLPAAAAGQIVQFRWRCGTDASVGGGGWFIDSVQFKAFSCCPGEQPSAPFIPASGFYNGLFFETNGVRLGSSGAFSASMTARGSYSGTLQMGASKFSVTGVFDPFGAASNNIPRTGTNALTLLMQVDTTDNSRITGTVSDGNWLAGLDAELSAFDAKTNPAPYVGNYALIFSGAGNPADATQPQGDGYALVSVATSGLVKISKGALADSAATFSESTKVSQDGFVALYSPLYSRKGQILGWLAFSNSTPNLSGSFSWIKPPNASATFYPNGFNVQSNAVGSKISSSPSLNFASGTVTLLGGNYFSTLAITATNTSAKPLIYRGTNNLSLTLDSPAPGLFKGSVTDPVSRKKISFTGGILETQQVASGFFLGTNQSGKISFGP
jgi:hypothetical protein